MRANTWRDAARVTRSRSLLASLPVEARVVLQLGDDAPHRWQAEGALPEHIDWTRMVALAADANMVSLLSDGIAPPIGDPSEVHDQIRSLAMTAEFRQARLADLLASVLSRLGAAGIDVVPLKGAALAIATYRSFGERPMGDIDLLVRRGDAERARQEMLGAGWETEPGLAGASYEHHHHLPPLLDPGGSGVALELHTDLFPTGHPFEPLRRLLWSGAERVEWQGRPVHVPRPAHHLVYVALHLAWSHQMGFGGVRALRDMRTLIERHAPDWDGVCQVATTVRGGSGCYWTLRLARHLAGAEVPKAVLARLRPPGPEALHKALERHFAHQLFPLPSRCPSISIGRAAWRLAMRPGWSGHGRTRPWDHAADFHDGGHPPGLGARVTGHLRDRSRWHLYLRALLGAAGPRMGAGDRRPVHR